ncbi:hypothetical protein MMPV_009766 [Pyropia vietnamensis]
MAKLVSARLFRHYALGLPASDSLAEFLSVTLHIAGSVFLVASALPGLTPLAHLAGRGANLSLLAAVCLLASTGWDVLAALAAHTLSYVQLPAADKALCDGVVALGTFSSAVARLNAALLLWLAGDGASVASAAGRRHGVWAAGLGVASMLVGLPLAVSPWEAGWGGNLPPTGGWARAHRLAVGVSATLIAASVVEMAVRLRLNAAIETATAVAVAAATSLGATDGPAVTVDPTLLGADASLSWVLLAAYVVLLVGAVVNQVRVGDLPTVDAWWAVSSAAAAIGGGGGGGGGRSRDVEAWGGGGGSGGDPKASRHSHAAPDAGGGGGGRGSAGVRHSSRGGRIDAAAVEPHDVDAYKLLRSKKYRRERRR